jgi:hypothetical protein
VKRPLLSISSAGQPVVSVVSLGFVHGVITPLTTLKVPAQIGMYCAPMFFPYVALMFFWFT